VNAAIKQIQSYVSEMSTSDFSPRAAGDSLSSLASAIQRIERKLDSMSGDGGYKRDALTDVQFLDKIRNEANPRRAFVEAYEAGDLVRCRSILPALHAKLGNTGEVLVSAAIFAAVGDTEAAGICLKILESPSELLRVESLKTGIGALVQYNDLVDGEKSAVKVLEPIIQTQITRSDIGNEDKAFILNQMQKLLYGAGEFEAALKNAEQVVSLNPTDEAYLFNLSLIYDQLGMKAKAVETVDKYMDIVGTEESDLAHLTHAAVIYTKVGRIENAKTILARMKKIDPRRTDILLHTVEELESLI
jgi:tetratricopeptide (TPR) repeat protein